MDLNPRFLLLLGVSGVGKSTIIRALRELDPRFVYISPYTTRKLRDGETDKIHVSNAQMDEMDARGEFIVVNPLYGYRYGTPRAPILSALAQGQFPLLDWPISKLALMKNSFDRLFTLYILPPSIDELRLRLGDGRDSDNSRLTTAIKELESYLNGEFDGLCDMCVVSETGQAAIVAEGVYHQYLQSLLS